MPAFLCTKLHLLLLEFEKILKFQQECNKIIELNNFIKK